MPLDAVTIGSPIRTPSGAALPPHQKKYLAKVEGKVARVTGASLCIGEAAARRLAVAGDRVSCTSRPNPEPDRSSPST
jgi:hypothetical protein